MRFFFVIPFIFIGAFLIGLTIDKIGDMGNFMIDIIGYGFILMAILIGRKKKENKQPS
ncbi:serine kinase [Heyndrickxia oleronia]|uniref:serine kinase n=1 Tax=Heyndrickxia oleronia TaxID=38875 RepID=UPI0024309D01|nr:serine kinase [Heyndrickxia oleronia]MCI1590536.1 serine kinase [Heyndrickxia oleronia]MCI1612574.1 serine kinase [Heyndrickxia oleronia]MCI1743801.1 serine kinase [Heyndrickxia oleronia]MCI1760511.1 serine kinase [Heyndrickxia oleronia]